MRLLIQSKASGQFLCPSLSGGEPGWVVDLREAGGGVVADVEAAHQLIDDCCEFDDLPVIVDLDRLGSANDYPVPLGAGIRALVDGFEGRGFDDMGDGVGL